MTREEMDRVIEEHFAMEARADLAGILATFTDDIEHDVVGMPGGPVRGKAAVRAFYEALTRDLPATDAIPRQRYYGDNVVIDEVIWEARAVGRPFGIAGQGRPVSVRLLHVFAFRDGLIAEHDDSFSFHAWSRQALGAPGLLLGWTPLLRNKVRSTARGDLEKFLAGDGARQDAPAS